MHKARDLLGQQLLSRVGRVAAPLLHAVLQAADVLQREKGQHLQKPYDVRVGYAADQVLVEFEGRQLVCSSTQEPQLHLALACITSASWYAVEQVVVVVQPLGAGL